MSSLIVEVCEIKEVIPHPNADRLDIATVKGWNCIVQKDSYRVGNWCVFFPPDSILPDWIIKDYELGFLKKGGESRNSQTTWLYFTRTHSSFSLYS